MKFVILLLVGMPLYFYGQGSTKALVDEDRLLIIESNPGNGFHHPYILFIPKGTPKNTLTYLLVEPNNTGRVSDSAAVHKKSAIDLASVSSVGNNISTMLNIPLLVPIFPRPESKPLVYTHALDRDVILEESTSLKRLDLQLIAMINEARSVLEATGIVTREQVFMNGFSASATFTNRFLFIHPELVGAAAMGGLNGKLMLPLKSYKNTNFKYPLGIHDFEEVFHKEFDRKAYETIPQYIYMGALDENDAVQYEDAYSEEERDIINSILGNHVQTRWKKCLAIYKEHNIAATFKTYEDVGHWTTSSVNMDVIQFFFKEMNK